MNLPYIKTRCERKAHPKGKLIMKKMNNITRAIALIMALVVGIMAVGAVKPEDAHAGDKSIKAGYVWPTGTLKENALRFSEENMIIDVIAGDPNLVPSKKEIAEKVAADVFYCYRTQYGPADRTTEIDKDYANAFAFVERDISFTDLYCGEQSYSVHLMDPCMFAHDETLSERHREESNKYREVEMYYFSNHGHMSSSSIYGNALKFVADKKMALENVMIPVGASFYSPSCYFEVVEWVRVPLADWTDDLAKGKQSLGDYVEHVYDPGY